MGIAPGPMSESAVTLVPVAVSRMNRMYRPAHPTPPLHAAPRFAAVANAPYAIRPFCCSGAGGSGYPVGIWKVSISIRPSAIGDDERIWPRMANEPGRPSAGTRTTPRFVPAVRGSISMCTPPTLPQPGVGAALAGIHLEAQLGGRAGDRRAADQLPVCVPSQGWRRRIVRTGRDVIGATAAGAVVDRVQADATGDR